MTYFSLSLFNTSSKKACVYIGAQWVLMTLMFEFIFGYFVANKSLAEILQVFNLLEGDLFTFVLLVSLISPILVLKLRGH